MVVVAACMTAADTIRAMQAMGRCGRLVLRIIKSFAVSDFSTERTSFVA
jgi:hypothetical protein